MTPRPEVGTATVRRAQTDGEWVQPQRRGFELECCDCGVVHRVNFRLRAGKVQFQAFRDARKTAATRRARRRP
jgi:hypothetical protein